MNHRHLGILYQIQPVFRINSTFKRWIVQKFRVILCVIVAMEYTLLEFSLKIKLIKSTHEYEIVTWITSYLIVWLCEMYRLFCCWVVVVVLFPVEKWSTLAEWWFKLHVCTEWRTNSELLCAVCEQLPNISIYAITICT